MEEIKESAVKQGQTGDDSGYSCTSTQSKYSVKSCHSQSASSGDSCFEEPRLNKLKITKDGKMPPTNSKSSERSKQKKYTDLSDLETTTIESSNISSKLEKVDLITFEPKVDQLFNIDELQQSSSKSKLELGESNNLNEVTNDLTTKFFFTNPNEPIVPDIVLKEFNEQEIQLKEIVESNKIHDDSFSVVVSMDDGFIVNTSNNIHRSMGYPKDVWQGRSFVDFIYPKDRKSFISYVTSILIDPRIISKQDGLSTVTFLRPKNNDGFYCNMRRYKGLNTGYSMPQNKNEYQVCKLTITFKDLSYTSTPSCTLNVIKIPLVPQLLLIVKAQLISSAYTHPDERKENPSYFITKHNALFEWCYADHLIIAHFGYLPQNIIGKSIFAYYNIEDLSTIKEIHQNMINSRSVPYKAKPYQFKCQNGDFALVQTEWSNFVNPWSGQVEFVTGRHKVIQGPFNPDVTAPIDDMMSEAQETQKNKNSNEIFEEIKKIFNKKTIERTDILHQINHPTINVKKQISNKCKDLSLFMNCLVEGIDPSVQVPLEVDVQPETCGSFSDSDSVMLGKISPHHNYESKSSTGTPPSYTQLNYNENIQRFFKSNLKINTSEDKSDKNNLTDIVTEEIITLNTDTIKIQPNALSLLQIVTPSSSTVNYVSTSYGSEQNFNNNCQQPLTQKTLLQHNKKMEDALVEQHKNNVKKIKSCEKPKQHVSDELIETPDITHGIKRSNSSVYENKSCKITKKKHVSNNDSTNKVEENKELITNLTVARGTQIWPPCQITRDSQTMVDLPRFLSTPSQVLCYNVPLSNNVMPAKFNEYENECDLMNLCEKNQGLLSDQLQTLNVLSYAPKPMMDHIPQNNQLLPPYLHCHNQIISQQPFLQKIKNKMISENETSVPIMSKSFYKEPKNLQVNQEEIITSSDSECKKEINSYKSSSGWIYEDSSFYSSSLLDKTDISSEREECSWPTEFNETNIRHQFVKKQPFWMEDIVRTPDLIYRYQIKHKALNEVLQKDMNALSILTQPQLVNEQLKQIYEELDANGTSKKSYFEDGTSSNSGLEEYSISNEKKVGKIDFARMAMIYEENAPIPPSTYEM